MTRATCHPERRHYVRGLCQRCYRASEAKPAPCHPERRLFARGMCRSCYEARPAPCHPERRLFARGMCRSCYLSSSLGHGAAKCCQGKAEYRDGVCRACYRMRGVNIETVQQMLSRLGVSSLADWAGRAE